MNSTLPPLPAWKEARLRNWWAGARQSSPCIAGWVLNPDARLPQARDPEQFWTDTEFIIARKMAELEQTTCYGCAVPLHYIDQGSSAMAGVLGCPLQYVDMETVWAHPRCGSLDGVFAVELDPVVPVYQRIRELTRRSAALAAGHHFVAPFALEGVTDLLAALYGIENFLVDVLDRPEDLRRAIDHLDDLWLRAFAETQTWIRAGGQVGGIGWAGVWAPGTTFPLQEDVAYNLAPDHFRRLCLPSLRRRMAALEYPYFHLDGVGMLPHLPLLLELEELPVIQWVPGAGRERLDQWHAVIRRILQAGKRVHLYARADEVAPLVDAVGPDGLFLTITDATHEKMATLLNRFPQQSLPA